MIKHRRLVLGQAFLLLLGVRLGLAFISFQRLRTILKSLSSSSKAEHDDSQITQQTVRQVIWAVEKSSSLMPGGAKCLAKALTTQVLMARRGCDCEFKIGVAKTDEDTLEAHAWIEKDGQVIMGFLPNLDRFTCLPSL